MQIRKSIAIVVFLVMMTIGIVGCSNSDSVSQEEYDNIKELCLKLQDENKDLKLDLKIANNKLEEAEPFFNLQEIEKEAIKLESEKKEQELKQQQALENSKTFSTGYYVVGEDIEQGKYDLVHVKGVYGFVRFGGNSYSIGTHKSYATEVKNVKLYQGDEIEVDGTLTVSFIPKN